MGILSFLSAAGMPIASALGGLASGISSNIQSERYLQGVRETNEANKQIAKEQNIANYEQWLRESAWNRKQWEDTNAWNLEQWNRENAYNDPSQQMARLRAAGINPYAALGQVQSGLSSSVSTNPAQPSTAPPAVGATLQAPDISAYRTGIPEAIQGIMSAAQIRLVNAQAKQEEFNAASQMLRFWKDMSEADVRIGKLKSEKQSLDFENQFKRDARADMMAQISATLANTRKQTEFSGSQISELQQRMSLNNARFDLDRQIAQFNMGQQRRLNDAQINQIYRSLDMAASRLALDWQAGKSMIDLNSAEYQKKINETVGQIFNNQLTFLNTYEKNALRKYSLSYMRQKMDLDLFEQKMRMFNPLYNSSDKLIGFGLGTLMKWK